MKNDKWTNGVVLSFDLKVELLNKFYDGKYNNAYRDIKNYLIDKGFEHLKDSDYVNKRIDKSETVDLLKEFISESKWFASVVNKVTVSPNVISLNITEDIRLLRDFEW